MADLYKARPEQFGGFTTPYPGSSSAGYYQQSLNLPYTLGRSILAVIPEYQRNPFQFEKDMAVTVIAEGRANMMRIILEQLEKGDGFTVNDVRYRFPIEVEPQRRIYLAPQTVQPVNSKGVTKIKIESNRNKIATAHPDGNIKQVGDIARLEVGQYILLMFSWVEPRRTNAVSGSSTVYYNPGAHPNAPVPEIAKIIDIDYENSTITIVRNWAGDRRTNFTYSAAKVPGFEVISTGSAVWGVTGAKVPQKFAFIIPMAKAMKEDEIDAKIRTYTGTWADGVLQRSLFAFGSQNFAEVISKNLGLPSPMARTREQAIKDFFDTWEYTAIFGEASENFDPETGYWIGTTDGILAKIPKSHYIAIKGIDWSAGFNSGNYNSFGTFNVYVFNKFLQGKAYYGSETKTLVCGADFYTSFVTMINFMTQNVPDIKSEWQVTGKRFVTSDGLTVNVIPSDAMTLNGMSNMAILYDSQYFKPVRLNNYPTMDLITVNNENPLKMNGFVHGVKGFIDLNPDAHWVFTVVDKKLPDGTDNSALYNSIDPLGQPLE